MRWSERPRSILLGDILTLPPPPPPRSFVLNVWSGRMRSPPCTLEPGSGGLWSVIQLQGRSMSRLFLLLKMGVQLLWAFTCIPNKAVLY